MVPTLVAGTFSAQPRRTLSSRRYTDYTVAARMQEKPRDLFDRVFTLTNADDADARAQRLKRSVLD